MRTMQLVSMSIEGNPLSLAEHQKGPKKEPGNVF